MKFALRKALLGAGAVVAGIAGSMAFSALGVAALPAYAASTTTPTISSIAAAPQTGGTSTAITWTTDIPASSQVNYGTTTSYGTYSILSNTTTPVTNHSITLYALSPNTTYHFVVLSGTNATSTASSTLAMSSDRTFTTGSSTSATTTAPTLSSVVASPTTAGATITWTTDKPATSQVNYGTSTSYGSSSTLDTTKTMSHSVTLSGLNSGTTYHFQALSSNSAGTSTSADQTFMTGTTTPPASLPVINNITVSPRLYGATVNWTTDLPSTSQVVYGLNSSYGATTTMSAASTTNHSVNLYGLNASTTYHFAARSGNSAGISQSVDKTFMTLAPTTTPPGGGIPGQIAALQHQIDLLNARITALEARVAALISGGGGTTTPPSGPAYIDQNGHTYQAGGQIDFGGHNFGTHEHVSITLNGQQVGSAFADLGGNFSTGSMTLPSTSGTYTYTFTGANSGRTAQATIYLTAPNNGGGSGTTTPPTSSAYIDQNGHTYQAGGLIDFGGHNFGHEENVSITMSGQPVGTAHADGGGNFSTGSMTLPSTSGTYTYTFTGANSGRTAQATVLVQ